MNEETWKLAPLDPGDKLDRRVRRRMRAFTKSPVAARRAAPFLPLERAVYAILVAVYALYAGARTVRVLWDARAAQGLPYVVASSDEPTGVTVERERAPRSQVTGDDAISRSPSPSAPGLPCSGCRASSLAEPPGV